MSSTFAHCLQDHMLVVHNQTADQFNAVTEENMAVAPVECVETEIGSRLGRGVFDNSLH
jgi:hypothetical protein